MTGSAMNEYGTNGHIGIISGQFWGHCEHFHQYILEE